jgi:2TM domain
MTDAFERAAQKEEAEHRRRGKERRSRGRRTGFEIHLKVFIGVQVLLVAIWALVWQFGDGTSHPWFAYALVGWGFGLAAHYYAVRDSLGGERTS